MLTRHDVKPIVFQRKKKDFIRYQRPIPGDRVQMDTCKIAPGIYQYTAIDDCSRYRVLDVFNRRSAANTLIFIDKVIEEMPFPIQRIQTDRGTEFFAEKVQRKLMDYGIKFRPNTYEPPGCQWKKIALWPLFQDQYRCLFRTRLLRLSWLMLGKSPTSNTYRGSCCCSFQFLLTGNGTRHSSVNLPLSYSKLSGCIDQLVSGSVKV